MVKKTNIDEKYLDGQTGFIRTKWIEDHEESFSEILKLNKNLIFFDVDSLVAFNDEYGLGISDELLTESARLIRNYFPREFPVFRLSGDEFAIIVKIQDDIEEKLREFLNSLLNDEYPCTVTGINLKGFSLSCSVITNLTDFTSDVFNKCYNLARKEIVRKKVKIENDGHRKYEHQSVLSIIDYKDIKNEINEFTNKKKIDF